MPAAQPTFPDTEAQLAAELGILSAKQKDLAKEITDLQFRLATLQASKVPFRKINPEPTILNILSYVAVAYNLTPHIILGPGRRHPATEARQMAMAIAHETTRMNLEEIGHACGKKDHGTVMHAIKTITIRRTIYPHLETIYQRILSALASPSLPPLPSVQSALSVPSVSSVVKK